MNDPAAIEQFLRHVPTGIPAEEIKRAWQALQGRYDVNTWKLPLPLWAKRPFDHNGQEAWQVLQQDLHRVEHPVPVCIYIHIPFCARKCGFCDSYSFQVKEDAQNVIHAYIDQVCAELRLWSQACQLNSRPISTVHLGGGTPAFIGSRELSRLVETIRASFKISPDTEWALETTATSLTPAMQRALHALGFSRLHIGVQTLEEGSRSAIGRRSTPAQLLDRLAAVRSLGWVVSVDLLCGLPYQTLSGFLAGIDQLISAGANGFSLYELLLYPQNRQWAETYGLTHRDHLPNYLMFQAGAALLAARGFQRNLFNHWADTLDRNIYFTFPTRGEDCLAVGTIADGVFGNYHYRHPTFAAWSKQAGQNYPALDGGLRRTPGEERLQPFITAVNGGSLAPSLLQDLENIAGGREMCKSWLFHRLVAQTPDGGLALTDSGAWFAGNLVADLEEIFTPSP